MLEKIKFVWQLRNDNQFLLIQWRAMRVGDFSFRTLFSQMKKKKKNRNKRNLLIQVKGGGLFSFASGNRPSSGCLNTYTAADRD